MVAAPVMANRPKPKVVRLFAPKAGLAPPGLPALMAANTAVAPTATVAAPFTVNRWKTKPATLAWKIGLAAVGVPARAPVRPAGNTAVAPTATIAAPITISRQPARPARPAPKAGPAPPGALVPVASNIAVVWMLIVVALTPANPLRPVPAINTK